MYSPAKHNKPPTITIATIPPTDKPLFFEPVSVSILEGDGLRVLVGKTNSGSDVGRISSVGNTDGSNDGRFDCMVGVIDGGGDIDGAGEGINRIDAGKEALIFILFS